MKKMTKILTVAAAIFSLALAQNASAVQITGHVDMNGSVTLNDTDLDDATAATAFANVVVGGMPTGDFAGTLGASVTYNAFSWNPASTPVTPLWTFNALGQTYIFNLNSINAIDQDSFFLQLAGSGTLDITGGAIDYDPTPGYWTFSVSDASGGTGGNLSFTFQSSNDANPRPPQVPDGGMTVALLGFALMGVEGLRRKLSK